MKVEFFGPEIKPTNYGPPGLELQPYQYSKVKREETMTLTLSREQTVLMHLTSQNMSGGSRYRVKLDGAVKFQ
jgi:hypothetical protein